MGGSGRIHQGFGLRLRASLPLPDLAAPAGPGAVDVELSAAPRAVVDSAFSGSTTARAGRDGFLGSGGRYRTERGIAGDLRVEYVRERRAASVHVAADGRHARCWAADPHDPSWQRFFLDTVLATMALARGFEALHAGAFARDGHAVAVVGGQGGGKSTLLAELVGRGRALVTDDVLALTRDGATPVAHPGPPLMNLPPRLPDGRAAADVGRVLAVLDGESWIVVDHHVTRALPLGAIVFLARAGRCAPAIDRLAPTSAPLLAHSLPSGTDPARLDARFALFAAVATSVPMFRARAPMDLPPAAVADAIEHALDGTHTRGSAA